MVHHYMETHYIMNCNLIIIFSVKDRPLTISDNSDVHTSSFSLVSKHSCLDNSNNKRVVANCISLSQRDMHFKFLNVVSVCTEMNIANILKSEDPCVVSFNSWQTRML